MMQLFNTPDDLAWVREVHAPNMPASMRAVVYTCVNEDWPTRIEGYRQKNPKVTDAPVFVWTRVEG